MNRRKFLGVVGLGAVACAVPVTAIIPFRQSDRPCFGVSMDEAAALFYVLQYERMDDHAAANQIDDAINTLVDCGLVRKKHT